MYGTHHVEFTGGPFDGHVQKISLDRAELSAVALLPVSRTIFAWLHGRARPVQSRITSVAEYVLDSSTDGCHYCFKCAHDPAMVAIRS